MQAQTHTRPCCTKAIHHSTKHQRLYRGKDSHIVRLEACKLHSVNLSLHSQPLIHPALCHSPVSLILKPFYSFSHYSRWCLCICSRASYSLNARSFTQPVSTFVAFNPSSTCLTAIGSLFIRSATAPALQHLTADKSSSNQIFSDTLCTKIFQPMNLKEEKNQHQPVDILQSRPMHAIY